MPQPDNGRRRNMRTRTAGTLLVLWSLFSTTFAGGGVGPPPIYQPQIQVPAAGYQQFPPPQAVAPQLVVYAQQQPVVAAPPVILPPQPVPQQALVLSTGTQVAAPIASSAADFNPQLLQGVRGYPGVRLRANQRAFQYGSNIIGDLLAREIKRARIPPISQCIPQVNGCIKVYNLYVSRFRCPSRTVAYPAPPNRVILRVENLDVGVTGNLGGQIVILLPIAITGIVQVNIHGATVTVETAVERGPTGSPYIRIVTCHMYIRYLDAYIENGGLIGDIANANFRDRISSQIKQMVPSQVCAQLPQLVNEKLNSRLSGLPSALAVTQLAQMLGDALGIGASPPTPEYCQNSCSAGAPIAQPPQSLLVQSQPPPHIATAPVIGGPPPGAYNAVPPGRVVYVLKGAAQAPQTRPIPQAALVLERPRKTRESVTPRQVQPASRVPTVNHIATAPLRVAQRDILMRAATRFGTGAGQLAAHVRVARAAGLIPPVNHNVRRSTQQQQQQRNSRGVQQQPQQQQRPIASTAANRFVHRRQAAPYLGGPPPLGAVSAPQLPPPAGVPPPPPPPPSSGPLSVPSAGGPIPPNPEAPVGLLNAPPPATLCSQCGASGGDAGAADPVSFLRDIGRTLDLGKLNDLFISLGLISTSATLNDYTIDLSGEVSPNGWGGTPFGAFPMSFPYPVGSSMVELLISDYTLNSLFYALHRKQFLTFRIGPDTPKIGPLLKTTCSDDEIDDGVVELDEADTGRKVVVAAAAHRIKKAKRVKRQTDGGDATEDDAGGLAELGICFGDILPAVRDKYPKQKLAVLIHTVRSPSVLLSAARGGSAQLNLLVDADIFIDGTSTVVGTITIDATVDTTLSTAGGRLSGTAEITQLRLTDRTGSLGLPQDALDNLGNLGKELVQKVANDALQRGIPISIRPSTGLPFSIVNPSIAIVEHALYITTDITVSPELIGSLGGDTC